MNDNGFFGGLFDLNHNGKLEPMEQAMDFAVFMHTKEEIENQNSKDPKIDSDDN